MNIDVTFDYLLSRKEELIYWTNEEEYAFVVRNKKIFDDFDSSLTMEERREVAERLIPMLPEKIRARGLDTSKDWMEKNIDRQISESYHFTIIHREFGGRHELHIQSANSVDGEKVILRISQTDFLALGNIFDKNYDDLSRQTQFKS